MNHQWITVFDYPGKKYSSVGARLSGRPMNIANHMIKKFDPDCVYVKKWLSHLKHIPTKDIIKWNTIIANSYNNIHPAPMFDPHVQYAKWINICKN